MIGRRSFLAGILGAAAAPAIVKASSLMKIVVPHQGLYTGEFGVIEEFRLVVSPAYSVAMSQGMLQHMQRELLRAARPSLTLESFTRSWDIPVDLARELRGQPKTLKLRRNRNLSP
jgi:hypothetical protein